MDFLHFTWANSLLMNKQEWKRRQRRFIIFCWWLYHCVTAVAVEAVYRILLMQPSETSKCWNYEITARIKWKGTKTKCDRIFTWNKPNINPSEVKWYTNTPSGGDCCYCCIIYCFKNHNYKLTNKQTSKLFRENFAHFHLGWTRDLCYEIARLSNETRYNRKILRRMNAVEFSEHFISFRLLYII